MQWTIAQLLKWTTEDFKNHEIETPRLDAEVLLADILGVNRINLYVNFDKPLTKKELCKFREFVSRRRLREPVAYIIGKKEFYSLPFFVSKDTLIPRPETELLVQKTLEWLKNFPDDKEKPSVLDIGTGSGAIVIALIHNFPHALYYGTDILSGAINIARKNAIELGLEKKVQFYKTDIFPPSQLNLSFDFIVSNPPYIERNKIDNLQPEVSKFEPKIALDGGENGLSFYNRIERQAKNSLHNKGKLIFEIGEGMASSVQKIFSKNNSYKLIDKKEDLSGIERILTFEKI